MQASTHSSVVEVDSVDLSRLDDAARCARLAELSVLAAKVDHQMAVLVAEMSADGTFDRAGCRSATTYLTDRVHLSRGRAQVIRAAGVATAPRVSLSGQVLEPKYRAIAAAAAEGALSADHVVAAAKALDALPDGVPEPQVAEAEVIMTGLARAGSCADIEAAGRRLLDHLDPDGDFRELGPTAKGRGLQVGTPGADGLTPIRGAVDPGAARTAASGVGVVGAERSQ